MRDFKTTGVVFKARDYIGSAEPPTAVLEDVSRFGNDGTFKASGEPNWVQEPRGLWVMDFDGADDCVNLGKTSSLNNLSEFTIMTWARFDAGYGELAPFVATKHGPVSASSFYFINHVNGTVDCRRGFSTTVANYTSTTVVPIETWTLLTYVLNSDKTIGIFINAEEVAYATETPGVGALLDDSGDDFLIGNSVGGDRSVNGKITLFRIHNRALSAPEIAAIFQAERSWFGK